MADRSPFAVMLTGGHPNSLGRTDDVVEMVLADPTQFEQLYQCYFDEDAVVRLRTSSAMKRLWRQQPAWFPPYMDRFLSEIAQIDQPSTRWTLAQMWIELDDHLTDPQRQRAKDVLKHNLMVCDDWIVIIQTLQTLVHWAKTDDELRDWLKPHLLGLIQDRRKSVAGKAEKLFNELYA